MKKEQQQNKNDEIRFIRKNFQEGHKNPLVWLERITDLLHIDFEDAKRIVGEHLYTEIFTKAPFYLTDLEGFERLQQYARELELAIKAVKKHFISTPAVLTPYDINAQIKDLQKTKDNITFVHTTIRKEDNQ